LCGIETAILKKKTFENGSFFVPSGSDEKKDLSAERIGRNYG